MVDLNRSSRLFCVKINDTTMEPDDIQILSAFAKTGLSSHAQIVDEAVEAGKRAKKKEKELDDDTKVRQLPRTATTALPGTEEKIAVMTERYRKGYSLFHPSDATFAGAHNATEEKTTS